MSDDFCYLCMEYNCKSCKLDKLEAELAKVKEENKKLKALNVLKDDELNIPSYAVLTKQLASMTVENELNKKYYESALEGQSKYIDALEGMTAERAEAEAKYLELWGTDKSLKDLGIANKKLEMLTQCTTPDDCGLFDQLDVVNYRFHCCGCKNKNRVTKELK